MGQNNPRSAGHIGRVGSPPDSPGVHDSYIPVQFLSDLADTRERFIDQLVWWWNRLRVVDTFVI